MKSKAKPKAGESKTPHTDRQIARGDWNPLWDTLRETRIDAGDSRCSASASLASNVTAAQKTTEPIRCRRHWGSNMSFRLRARSKPLRILKGLHGVDFGAGSAQAPPRRGGGVSSDWARDFNRNRPPGWVCLAAFAPCVQPHRRPFDSCRNAVLARSQGGPTSMV